MPTFKLLSFAIRQLYKCNEMTSYPASWHGNSGPHDYLTIEVWPLAPIQALHMKSEAIKSNFTIPFLSPIVPYYICTDP